MKINRKNYYEGEIMYKKIWQKAKNIQLNGSDEKQIIDILFGKDNLDAN